MRRLWAAGAAMLVWLVLSVTPALAQEAAAYNPALAAFIEECGKTRVAEADMATLEKRGVDTGLKAVHPISGAEVPIWAANFVLMEYGAGAVMAVPAHDQRDYEFAQQNGIPVIQVVHPASDAHSADLSKAAFTDKGVLQDSGDFSGLTSAHGRQIFNCGLSGKECPRCSFSTAGGSLF